MVAALLADLFESHRAHLLSVAYRLTGSVGDAEDAMQEVWLRLIGTHQSEIDELLPWLIGVTSQVCLERLRSSARRREDYAGQWLPEPVVGELAPSSRPDALAALARKPEARLATMVALDTLTPSQRVAYVLHEGFSVPIDEIACLLEVSVDGARQLVVESGSTMAAAPAPVPDAEHEVAVRRFLEALKSGDATAVTAALHPDSVLMADANGPASAGGVITGAERIARFYLDLLHRYGLDVPAVDPALAIEFASVNGQLGLVVRGRPVEDGQIGYLARVIGFTVRDEVVWGTYDLANRAKLSRVRPS